MRFIRAIRLHLWGRHICLPRPAFAPEEHSPPPPAAMEKSRWMQFAGMIDTGDSRSSQSVDEIVYGGKD